MKLISTKRFELNIFNPILKKESIKIMKKRAHRLFQPISRIKTPCTSLNEELDIFVKIKNKVKKDFEPTYRIDEKQGEMIRKRCISYAYFNINLGRQKISREV